MTNQSHKKLLNTFKSGIVPEGHLDFILTGREAETRSISKCLQASKSGLGSLKFITGPYGSGKTFLLNYASEMALEENFIVSKIQVDTSFKFYNLKQFYYHIMHNLYVFKNHHNKTNFEDIFDLWIEKLKSPDYIKQASKEITYVISEVSKYNQSFAQAFLSYIKSRVKKEQGISEGVVAWLTGESNIPFQVKEKFNIKGDITQENALDFLKAFNQLIILLGYSGLVILIDEMDFIMTERSDLRLKAYHNLRHLIDLTITNHLPHTCMFFSGSDALFKSEEKGILSYEALAQRLNVSTKKSKILMSDSNQSVIFLNKLDFEMYSELSEKLTYIYKKVYPLELKISIESLKNWVFFDFKEQGISFEDISIREFIIKYLSFLEQLTTNPENQILKFELYAFFENKDLVFKSQKPPS
jgi:hypothetical protein